MRIGSIVERTRQGNLRAFSASAIAAMGAVGLWGVLTPSISGQRPTFWEAAQAHDDAIVSVWLVAGIIAVAAGTVAFVAVATAFRSARSGRSDTSLRVRISRTLIITVGNLLGFVFAFRILRAVFGEFAVTDLDAGTFEVYPATTAWYLIAIIAYTYLVVGSAWVLTDPENALGSVPATSAQSGDQARESGG